MPRTLFRCRVFRRAIGEWFSRESCYPRNKNCENRRDAMHVLPRTTGWRVATKSCTYASFNVRTEDGITSFASAVSCQSPGSPDCSPWIMAAKYPFLTMPSTSQRGNHSDPAIDRNYMTRPKLAAYCTVKFQLPQLLSRCLSPSAATTCPLSWCDTTTHPGSPCLLIFRRMTIVMPTSHPCVLCAVYCVLCCYPPYVAQWNRWKVITGTGIQEMLIMHPCMK